MTMSVSVWWGLSVALAGKPGPHDCPEELEEKTLQMGTETLATVSLLPWTISNRYSFEKNIPKFFLL